MYQAVYKCRLCEKEYEGCVTKNKNVALSCVCEIMSREYFYPNGSGIGIHRLDCHNCQDGSLGLADFIGFRKVEE